MKSKITFLDIEDIPRSSKVLYCFTPYESYDKRHKRNLVFKCGLSNGRFNNRLENYHTAYPFGVYILQVLELPSDITKPELLKAEKLLFKLLVEKDDSKTKPAKRLHSITRVQHKNEDGGRTEWFYGEEPRIQEVFEKLYDMYEVVHLKSYDFAAKIKDDAKKGNNQPKNIFVGENIVDLGINFI
jgi:hypothetical protein